MSFLEMSTNCWIFVLSHPLMNGCKAVMDKTLTPRPWTTLKRTTPKNIISAKNTISDYSCFEKGCLTNGKKLTWQCRKLLWVVFTVTAVSRKVVLQMGKSLSDNVASYYGGFYSCLSEQQGASAWWKETAQTRVFVLPPSLLLNHFKPQSRKA